MKFIYWYIELHRLCCLAVITKLDYKEQCHLPICFLFSQLCLSMFVSVTPISQDAAVLYSCFNKRMHFLVSDSSAWYLKAQTAIP